MCITTIYSVNTSVQRILAFFIFEESTNRELYLYLMHFKNILHTEYYKILSSFYTVFIYLLHTTFYEILLFFSIILFVVFFETIQLLTFFERNLL